MDEGPTTMFGNGSALVRSTFADIVPASPQLFNSLKNSGVVVAIFAGKLEPCLLDVKITCSILLAGL